MEAVLIVLIVCGMVVFVVWLLIESDKPKEDPYDYLDPDRTSLDDVNAAIRKDGGDPEKIAKGIIKVLSEEKEAKGMIIVRIVTTDAHTGVKKGEVYVAEPYRVDPSEKCSLLRRLPDMHEPMCNQYWKDVSSLGEFRPRKGWEKV